MDFVFALLKDEQPDEERNRRINDAIMADVLGEAPIAPPASRLSYEVSSILHTTLALYSSVDRFKVFEQMFRRYPWRGAISRKAHLESTFYLYAHETYILEERLKKFLVAIETYTKVRPIAFQAADVRKQVLRAHKAAFGEIVRLRGSHVHEEEIAPREIKRVSLLEILSLEPAYRDLYSVALKHARSVWIAKSRVAKQSAEEVTAMAFALTKPVWATLIDDAAK